MPDAPKTYTQDELDAAVADRNKALEATHQKALGQLAETRKALKSFEGIDPNDYKAMREAAEKLEEERAKAQGDWKAREAQLTDRQKKELEAKDARIGKLSKVVERRVKSDELSRAIAKAGGDADLLLPHAERFAKVQETDEDFNLVLTDEKGAVVDADAFVAQTLKPKFPSAFAGTGSSGGGATRSAASGGNRVIPAGDNPAFIANLKDIASGKVNVAGY